LIRSLQRNLRGATAGFATVEQVYVNTSLQSAGRHCNMVQKWRFIGVARGCTGALHPQSGEKEFWGPNLQTKVVSALPGRECSLPPAEAEQESIFKKLGNLDGGKGYLGSFRVFW